MENKTSKYFKYAIGEIILVVIGILIALQINNWNKQRKDNKLEAEYYCRLLEDIEQDKQQINQLKLFADNRLKASNEALRLLQQESPNSIDVGKQNSLAIKAIYFDFKPNNTAFEDLKSGAKLSVIKDKDIIKSLNIYYNNIETLKSIIIVNGKRAVDISFAHEDRFANGHTQASIEYGRFKEGMDKDVLKNISTDTIPLLTKSMHKRLYNEALVYISTNTRQIELLNYLIDYTSSMSMLLQNKCVSTD
ncbi:DUF6090 family protein [Yeosuana sp. MJ-SS3]|uniref:DUF6090 family protein n=2 Tax=Gilvirhabdus luticola TaxID=3079858 RepID=A0ABU3U9Y9_9FLAO|nr:DUF6090 family protein [Yeosuana sp. MJ-SS3]